MGRLDGRRIIVTGGASGIGAATARLFHREGARLALVDRNAAGLQGIVEELSAAARAFDLTELDAIEAHVDALALELGGVDGVVNCAGIGVAQPIGDIAPERLSQIYAVNLAAPFLICRAALPHMRKAGRGTVVNVASGQGILPNTPNNTAYAATKGGLVAFTKAFAAEAAPEVRANIVCPGVTNTPMAAPLLAGVDNPSDAPWLKQVALKRVADPDEIARAILYLSSDESSYVTGSTLVADGGRCFH